MDPKATDNSDSTADVEDEESGTNWAGWAPYVALLIVFVAIQLWAIHKQGVREDDKWFSGACWGLEGEIVEDSVCVLDGVVVLKRSDIDFP